MAKNISLTASQKAMLQRIEPVLEKALFNMDLKEAQNLIIDLRSILAPTKHYAQLAEYRNKVNELAIEIASYDIAERELLTTLKTLNKNTRAYLETSALLAVCYIRMQKYEQAKPFIREVLQNEKVIKSSGTRQKFHKEIIERFTEEAVLSSLKETHVEKLNPTEIEGLAVDLLKTYETNDALYVNLSMSLPSNTKVVFLQIDGYAKNQLPSAEQLALPPSTDIDKEKVIGKTVFASLKRVIYNSLCDSKSDVYKAIFSNGLGIALDKKYIATAIVAALADVGIGLKALAVSAVALVIRFGLDWYCEHYKPLGVVTAKALN